MSFIQIKQKISRLWWTIMGKVFIFIIKALPFIFFITGTLIVVLIKSDNVKEELFYVQGQILDIKRDDDGVYHLLVRLHDGKVVNMSDVRCSITMGNYEAKALVPYLKYTQDKKTSILQAWEWNSTKTGSLVPIQVLLPSDYKIELFKD